MEYEQILVERDDDVGRPDAEPARSAQRVDAADDAPS